MAKEKKLVTAYVLDNKGLSEIMDIHGFPEKKPMLHSFVSVYDDHSDIGGKLLATPKDGVFSVEYVDEAIEKYDSKKKEGKSKDLDKKDDDKKKKDPSNKDGSKKGNYDTKVMTPSK